MSSGTVREILIAWHLIFFGFAGAWVHAQDARAVGVGPRADRDALLNHLVANLTRQKRMRADMEPVRLESCRLALVQGNTGLSLLLVEGNDEQIVENYTRPIRFAAEKHIRQLAEVCDLDRKQITALEVAARGDREQLERRLRGWQSQFGRIGKTHLVMEAIEAHRRIDQDYRKPVDSDERLLGKVIHSILTEEQLGLLKEHELREKMRYLLVGMQRVASLDDDKLELVSKQLQAEIEGIHWALESNEFTRLLSEKFLAFEDEEVEYLSASELAAMRRLCHYYLIREGKRF